MGNSEIQICPRDLKNFFFFNLLAIIDTTKEGLSQAMGERAPPDSNVLGTVCYIN